ncbi:MAG: hypothetical protein ACKORJ_01750, partial [Bacteroidota bacterium]
PVLEYFTGERNESYGFLAMGVITLGLGVYFFLVRKGQYLRGMALPFLLVAVLEIIVGITIVTRSPKDIVRVEGYLLNDLPQIELAEIPRMETVMRNFVVFRYVEIALIITGLVILFRSARGTFWRGFAAGLALQAAIVLSLDFFAERRGHEYLKFLREGKGSVSRSTHHITDGASS